MNNGRISNPESGDEAATASMFVKSADEKEAGSFPGIIIRDKAADKRQIVIIGQPRSGTVAFWKTFRQDERLRCLNEPFHPLIRHHVDRQVDSHKQTMVEYMDVPDVVRAGWSTIQPYEETYRDLIPHQADFLRSLVHTADRTCFKMIRCCAKIPSVRAAIPGALIVHLVRDPRAWVTSHLRPYGKWLPGLPNAFFRHDGWFDFWSRQQIANYQGFKGYAHEQLLQIWDMFTAAAEASLPDVTVQFEAFALDPEGVVRTIYERVGLEYRPLDYGMIHAPNEPFRSESAEWSAAVEKHLSSATRPFLFSFGDLHAEHQLHRRSAA